MSYSPHLSGLSFALGLFIISLPNLGAGILVVSAIGYRADWANPTALAAAAVIMNPLVKSGIYATSFAVGTVLLGPAPGVFDGTVSLDAGFPIIARLFVGNVLIAVLFAVAGYGTALYCSRLFTR